MIIDSQSTHRVVEVTAPSRLHLGMLSFGQSGVRQFGGAGVMIDTPGLQLRVTAAERLHATGMLNERALAFAQRYLAAVGGEIACRIHVVHAAQQHAGLGVGTQLGMAVAAGLAAFRGQPSDNAARLAIQVGRGARSAIGVHGFAHGGLLVEAGKIHESEIAPLLARVELPDEWRFVLARPADEVGLCGDNERAAFAQLPPIPEATTSQLCRELLLRLLPAAAAGDFRELSESLYRYGRLAGDAFSTQQHGAYASGRLTSLIDELRAWDIHGVGQSSWGPTVFALAADQREAERLVLRLQAWAGDAPWELAIARPANQGAFIDVKEPSATGRQH